MHDKLLGLTLGAEIVNHNDLYASQTMECRAGGKRPSRSGLLLKSVIG